MKKNKMLIAFVAGLCAYPFMPVLDSLSGVIQSACNKMVAGWQMQLELDNAEHQAAVEEVKPLERNGASAIGFEIQSDSCCEEDE